MHSAELSLIHYSLLSCVKLPCIHTNMQSSSYSPRNDQLICDLQTMISYTSAKDGASKTNAHEWENHSSLALKLRDFIPTPLSPTDLTELDPNQSTSESIPPLIFEELASTNNVLKFLQSSIQSLSDFLNGHLRFTVLSGSMLTALSNSTIPEDWNVVLSTERGFPRKLMPALKLLRERFSFYIDILQSRTVPSEFSPLMISRPSDLMTRTLHSFAREHQLHPCNLSLQAQVCVQYSYPKNKNISVDLNTILYSGKHFG